MPLMGSTKQQSLPGNLSLEDLLEAINSPQEHVGAEKPLNDDSTVYGFLVTYGIKPGNYPVKARLFYELYKRWTKDPLEKASFDYQIAKYLVYGQKYNQKIYFIDKDAFKISEEIQRLLTPKNKTKSKSYKKHFETYLKKYNIKPGNFWVESYVLYYLYDKWVYGIKKKTPLGEQQFHLFCKLYFKHKRIGSSRVMWFGVNGEDLMKIVPKSKIKRIREGRKFRYGKKSKRSKEISSN